MKNTKLALRYKLVSCSTEIPREIMEFTSASLLNAVTRARNQARALNVVKPELWQFDNYDKQWKFLSTL